MSVQAINDGARCRPEDWELFVTDDQSRWQRRAIEICNTCPVKEMCLEEHFLEQDVVVGGTTWGQRVKRLRDGDYPPSVARKIGKALIHRGMYRISAMGLPQDVGDILTIRHGGGS